MLCCYVSQACNCNAGLPKVAGLDVSLDMALPFISKIPDKTTTLLTNLFKVGAANASSVDAIAQWVVASAAKMPLPKLAINATSLGEYSPCYGLRLQRQAHKYGCLWLSLPGRWMALCVEQINKNHGITRHSCVCCNRCSEDVHPWLPGSSHHGSKHLIPFVQGTS